MGRRFVPLIIIFALFLTFPAIAQENTRWLGKSGCNAQVELTVFDITMAPLAEQTGRVSITVATAWRNIAPPQRMGEIEWKTSGVGGLATFGRARPPTGRAAVQHTSYLVPKLSDHVYLVNGNGGIARLDDNREIRLPRQHDEVEWLARFEIDKTETDALLLVFFDFDHGHITIPLTERVPPREGNAPVSEDRNAYLRARVYGSRTQGDDLEIDLGLLSTSEGNAVEIELSGAIGLLRPDGAVVEPAENSAVHWLTGTARILPDWEQRGRLLFTGGASGDPGVLEIVLPGVVPLHLPVKSGANASAATVQPGPKVLHTWEDGEGLHLELLQATPDLQSKGLLVRVRVVNRCGSDLSFSPAAQFRLVADGREVSVQASGNENDGTWVVRDGATRMLELRYALKGMPAKAQIRYQGFEADNTVPLEVTRR
ncbi:MAG: hypothetical protein JZU50_02635 [Desulfobulbaceae bacterium]|nr:hypothetical protein [Desulfobulbaceae bacterium]